MELREAVKFNHDRAEQTALSRLMISGNMRDHTYAAFLENMLEIYKELERDGMLIKPEVLRQARAEIDLVQMGGPKWGLANSVKDYVSYLSRLPSNDRWAHVYVHYLGNMYGGQMIGKMLPGPHAHLLFDDLKGCIAYVRENIQDISHHEANMAFEWTIRIYDELHQLFG